VTRPTYPPHQRRRDRDEPIARCRRDAYDPHRPTPGMRGERGGSRLLVTAAARQCSARPGTYSPDPEEGH